MRKKSEKPQRRPQKEKVAEMKYAIELEEKYSKDESLKSTSTFPSSPMEYTVLGQPPTTTFSKKVDETKPPRISYVDWVTQEPKWLQP